MSEAPHPDELRRAAARADADALAELLLQLPEKRRRELADDLQERTRQPLVSSHLSTTSRAQHHTAQIAWFGTGLARDLRWTTLLVGQHEPSPRLPELLAARPARVRDGIARGMLVHSPHLYWPLVRQLMDAGELDTEVGQDYLLAMVRWLGATGYGGREQRDPAEAIVAELANEPRIADELWVALELEEVVEWMSAGHWTEALVRAADDGLLDRGKLVEVAATGLLRDLRPGGTALFRRILQALGPTTDELADHAGSLVRALGGSHPPEQRVAARWLRELVDAGHPVDGGAVAAAVVTPLTGKQKTAAIEALRLLAAVELDAVERGRAAATALGHAHLDVQAAALTILETIPAAEDGLPAAVREELLPWLEAVAPAHRPRLEALVGVDAVLAPGGASAAEAHDLHAATDELDDLAARAAAVPVAVASLLGVRGAVEAVGAGTSPAAARFDVAAVPVRAPALVPVVDLDELIELLTILLAGSGDALDLERAIDGLARFGPSRLTAGTVQALRRKEPWQPLTWDGWSATELVSAAVEHWVTGQPPLLPPYLTRNRRLIGTPPLRHDLAVANRPDTQQLWRTAFDGHEHASGMLGFLATRLWEAVTIGLSSPRPILALPTSVDGWLAPEELRARLEAHPSREAPCRFDAVQALLRLQPARRDEVPPTDVGPPALATALQHWHDQDRPGPDDAGLARAVAARSLSPRGLVRAQVNHRWSQQGRVVRLDLPAPRRPRRRDDPVGELHEDLLVPSETVGPSGWWTPFASALPPADPLLASWSLLALPRHRDLLELKAASLLAEDIDQNRANDGLHTIVAHLVDPDTPLGWSGHLLLAVGTVAGNEGVVAATTDALAAAAGDGRLDPELLGWLLAELGALDVARAARFASSLEAIVDDTVLTADAVRRVLQAWLGAITELPRDAHAPLAVLERACDRSRRGVDDPQALAALEAASAGRSKRARSAARLRDLPDAGSGPADPERLRALVARAERWAAAAAG